jgi:hypothetical protein
MDWQALAAGVLVAGCMGWSVWTLMPAALRSRCRKLWGAAQPVDAASACGGCTGCGGAATRSGGEQVVRIVRRAGGG